MPKPRRPVEQFDLASGQPIRVFPRLRDVERAGFKNSSVQQCLAGNHEQHHEYGWRDADAESYLPRRIAKSRPAEHFEPEVGEATDAIGLPS